MDKDKFEEILTRLEQADFEYRQAFVGVEDANKAIFEAIREFSVEQRDRVLALSKEIRKRNRG